MTFERFKELWIKCIPWNKQPTEATRSTDALCRAAEGDMSGFKKPYSSPSDEAHKAMMDLKEILHEKALELGVQTPCIAYVDIRDWNDAIRRSGEIPREAFRKKAEEAVAKLRASNFAPRLVVGPETIKLQKYLDDEVKKGLVDFKFDAVITPETTMESLAKEINQMLEAKILPPQEL